MRSQCGASVGNTKDTSGVWLYVVEVEADDAGKNVKCMVKTKLPASGLLQARETTCGHRMKYVRADKATGIKSGGTSDFLSHLLPRSFPVPSRPTKESCSSMPSRLCSRPISLPIPNPFADQFPSRPIPSRKCLPSYPSHSHPVVNKRGLFPLTSLGETQTKNQPAAVKRSHPVPRGAVIEKKCKHSWEYLQSARSENKYVKVVFQRKFLTIY